MWIVLLRNHDIGGLEARGLGRADVCLARHRQDAAVVLLLELYRVDAKVRGGRFENLDRIALCKRMQKALASRLLEHISEVDVDDELLGHVQTPHSRA
jgi:hypothetical protein